VTREEYIQTLAQQLGEDPDAVRDVLDTLDDANEEDDDDEQC
jgi:phage terminase small subunit